ncbi:gas vesicle protein GvpN [Brevibacillus dissolubilis]|uniref:gas vesicle protein GvpN n=1 Tax=Brevibacillus dissolubilis TaxID=1844116 RepID=UPI00159BB69B|nr:gas vesicle protein GvpN [Brevibacillus dissolubilis]
MEHTEHSLFVQTPFFQDIVSRSLRFLRAGFPIHLLGPSGVGKTCLSLHIARQLNRPVTVIRGHHSLSNEDLLGGYLGYSKKEVVDNYIRSVYKKHQDIKPVWVNGLLIEAVQHGHTLIFDEFTRAKPETNNIFLSVLEERVLPLYGLQKEKQISVHPDFSVIFTSNPEEYAGVYKSQDALMDRLITISLGYCDMETEEQIIRDKTGIDIDSAHMIARIVSSLRAALTEKRHAPSLRASLMIAQTAKATETPIDPRDPIFQQLCIDVLWLSVYKGCGEEDQHAVQRLITMVCHQVGDESEHV